jgi:SpoVK/Ycf46/Vps4 family AAA+-type ATPase
MQDLLDALKNISKSVNKSQLDEYQKWMDEFGSV